MDDAGKPLLNIEIVFAEAAKQELLSLNVPSGATVQQAISMSGIAELFPDVDFTSMHSGIWGRPAEATQALQDGDRVEIYRPLEMDPREARRQLALHGRAMGQKDVGET